MRMIAARRSLRVLFALGFAWAVISLLAAPLFTWAQDSPHRTAQEFAVMAAVLVGSGVLVWGVCRRWPRFLEIPPGVAVVPVLLRWVAFVPVFLLALAVFCGGVEWIHLRLTGDPTHSQYGVSVLFAAIWYPVSLSPLLAVIAAWLDARRRGRPLPA